MQNKTGANRKRHFYEVVWEDEVYVACDFPGGVLISTAGWRLWWPRYQFVPGYCIDHDFDPPRLEQGFADRLKD